MEIKSNTVKASIILDGQTHEIMISKERAIQIKRLQKLIMENWKRKEKTKNIIKSDDCKY